MHTQPTQTSSLYVFSNPVVNQQPPPILCRHDLSRTPRNAPPLPPLFFFFTHIVIYPVAGAADVFCCCNLALSKVEVVSFFLFRLFSGHSRPGNSFLVRSSPIAATTNAIYISICTVRLYVWYCTHAKKNIAYKQKTYLCSLARRGTH